jgi:hypothetical protein
MGEGGSIKYPPLSSLHACASLLKVGTNLWPGASRVARPPFITLFSRLAMRCLQLACLAAWVMWRVDRPPRQKLRFQKGLSSLAPPPTSSRGGKIEGMRKHVGWAEPPRFGKNTRCDAKRACAGFLACGCLLAPLLGFCLRQKPTSSASPSGARRSEASL